jgi:hypothetical protein
MHAVFAVIERKYLLQVITQARFFLQLPSDP